MRRDIQKLKRSSDTNSLDEAEEKEERELSFSHTVGNLHEKKNQQKNMSDNLEAAYLTLKE